MRYRKLGRTGLEVSALCLGCMAFGDPVTGSRPWTLDEQGSRAIIRRALDAGVNFFDTANSYSDGSSEEFLGRAVVDYAPRADIVIATKLYRRMRPGPNGAGLSRKAIFTEVDESLRRLHVDYIDLYQIHRWDESTPIAETLEALNDLVRLGKVRYLGASSMAAWQFAKALYTADLRGWTRFASMQPLYNLISRDEEREMFPLCAAEGIAVIPWSPLARGRLTRLASVSTKRGDNDEVARRLYGMSHHSAFDRLARIASRRGVPPAQVALAWVMHNPVVTAPVVGATRPEHLDDAVAATELTLEQFELDELNERDELTAGHAPG